MARTDQKYFLNELICIKPTCFYNPLIGSATASGSFVTNQSATISFTNNTNTNIEDGTIDLTANTASFNQGASLNLLSDGNPSWQGAHSGFGNTTLNITAAGEISGNESTENCDFTGTVSVPDASKNI